MMNGKSTLVMVCAVGASLLHAGAEAASARDGLEACVSALAQEISDAQGAGVDARISDDSRYGRGQLRNRTVFYLDARDPGSAEVVLKADCIVNARGEVKSLNRLPADAPEATERSL
jgi:hypothetical protein